MLCWLLPFLFQTEQNFPSKELRKLEKLKEKGMTVTFAVIHDLFQSPFHQTNKTLLEISFPLDLVGTQILIEVY